MFILTILSEQDTWCFSVSAESNRDIIEITGTKGFIRFSTFSFEPIVLVNESGRQEFINERPEHVQYNLIGKIVRALEGKGTAPSTGVTAARTSRVMDEVVREYYKGIRLNQAARATVERQSHR